MKRTLSVLFLIVYVVSVSGTMLSIHFCGKKLQSVSLAVTAHNTCCCGKKKMDSSCCKNKTVYVKVKSEHGKTVTANIPMSSEIKLFSQFSNFLVLNFAANISFIAPDYHSPPIIKEGCELLILNSVLRV